MEFDFASLSPPNRDPSGSPSRTRSFDDANNDIYSRSSKHIYNPQDFQTFLNLQSLQNLNALDNENFNRQSDKQLNFEASTEELTKLVDQEGRQSFDSLSYFNDQNHTPTANRINKILKMPRGQSRQNLSKYLQNLPNFSTSYEDKNYDNHYLAQDIPSLYQYSSSHNLEEVLERGKQQERKGQEISLEENKEKRKNAAIEKEVELEEREKIKEVEGGEQILQNNLNLPKNNSKQFMKLPMEPPSILNANYFNTPFTESSSTSVSHPFPYPLYDNMLTPSFQADPAVSKGRGSQLIINNSPSSIQYEKIGRSQNKNSNSILNHKNHLFQYIPSLKMGGGEINNSPEKVTLAGNENINHNETANKSQNGLGNNVNAMKNTEKEKEKKEDEEKRKGKRKEVGKGKGRGRGKGKGKEEEEGKDKGKAKAKARGKGKGNGKRIEKEERRKNGEKEVREEEKDEEKEEKEEKGKRVSTTLRYDIQQRQMSVPVTQESHQNEDDSYDQSLDYFPEFKPNTFHIIPNETLSHTHTQTQPQAQAQVQLQYHQDHIQNNHYRQRNSNDIIKMNRQYHQHQHQNYQVKQKQVHQKLENHRHQYKYPSSHSSLPTFTSIPAQVQIQQNQQNQILAHRFSESQLLSAMAGRFVPEQSQPHYSSHSASLDMIKVKNFADETSNDNNFLVDEEGVFQPMKYSYPHHPAKDVNEVENKFPQNGRQRTVKEEAQLQLQRQLLIQQQEIHKQKQLEMQNENHQTQERKNIATYTTEIHNHLPLNNYDHYKFERNSDGTYTPIPLLYSYREQKQQERRLEEHLKQKIEQTLPDPSSEYYLTQQSHKHSYNHGHSIHGHGHSRGLSASTNTQSTDLLPNYHESIHQSISSKSGNTINVNDLRRLQSIEDSNYYNNDNNSDSPIFHSDLEPEFPIPFSSPPISPTLDNKKNVNKSFTLPLHQSNIDNNHFLHLSNVNAPTNQKFFNRRVPSTSRATSTPGSSSPNLRSTSAISMWKRNAMIGVGEEQALSNSLLRQQQQQQLSSVSPKYPLLTSLPNTNQVFSRNVPSSVDNKAVDNLPSSSFSSSASSSSASPSLSSSLSVTETNMINSYGSHSDESIPLGKLANTLSHRNQKQKGDSNSFSKKKAKKIAAKAITITNGRAKHHRKKEVLHPSHKKIQHEQVQGRGFGDEVGVGEREVEIGTKNENEKRAQKKSKSIPMTAINTNTNVNTNANANANANTRKQQIIPSYSGVIADASTPRIEKVRKEWRRSSSGAISIIQDIPWKVGRDAEEEECLFYEFQNINEYENFASSTFQTETGSNFFFVNERGRKWSRANNPARRKILFKDMKICYYGRYYRREQAKTQGVCLCPSRMTAIGLPTGKVQIYYWNKHDFHDVNDEYPSTDCPVNHYPPSLL